MFPGREIVQEKYLPRRSEYGYYVFGYRFIPDFGAIQIKSKTYLFATRAV